MRYMTYKGRNVPIRREVDEAELEQLKQDAERVLGLRPALGRSRRRGCDSEYLTPPPESDSAHSWATRILEVVPPAVEVWVGYPMVVSLSELNKSK